MIAVLVVSAFLKTSSAQETQILAGRVVEPSGAAVAGARVWIVEGHALAGLAETVAETITDPAGRFSTAVPAASSRPDSPLLRLLFAQRVFDVVVQARDGRFGWLSQNNVPRKDGRDMKVELADCVEARGRMVDPAGKPIRGAHSSSLSGFTSRTGRGLMPPGRLSRPRSHSGWARGRRPTGRS